MKGIMKSSLNEALEPITPKVTQVLVENHQRFRAFLAKRVGSDQLAEDLLQQSLVKAVANPPSASDDVSILSWFYQTLKNTVIDHYRAQGSRDQVMSAFARELETTGRNSVPALDELKESVCGCMKALVTTLKPEYAEVIRSVDLDEGAPDKVASRLGISLGNLNVRLHRARVALKTRLEQTCGTCTEHGCLNCDCGSP